jgi:hypothetical protein
MKVPRSAAFRIAVAILKLPLLSLTHGMCTVLKFVVFIEGSNRIVTPVGVSGEPIKFTFSALLKPCSSQIQLEIDRTMIGMHDVRQLVSGFDFGR